jgi:hypothetical protein
MTERIPLPAEGERWLPVVGYEGIYEVSDHGRVRRAGPANGTHVGRILKPYQRGAYLYANLKARNTQRSISLHRIVAWAFHGPPPPGHEVNHKDGNKLNPRADNLEWVTKSENCRHAHRLGLVKYAGRKGEAHPRVKLTDRQVEEIRQLRGKATPSEIAERYGISRGYAWKLREGRMRPSNKDARIAVNVYERTTVPPPPPAAG